MVAVESEKVKKKRLRRFHRLILKSSKTGDLNTLKYLLADYIFGKKIQLLVTNGIGQGDLHIAQTIWDFVHVPHLDINYQEPYEGQR